MAVKKDRITLDIISKYIKMLKKNKVKFSEIYLFGSHVKGTYNPDSDIDLAIVLDKKYVDRFNERLKLMKLRWDVDLRIEPHPFSKKDFEDTDPFVKEITINGIRIA